MTLLDVVDVPVENVFDLGNESGGMPIIAIVAICVVAVAAIAAIIVLTTLKKKKKKDA